MKKKIIDPQVIFIIGLVLLSGCTSYMKGTMDLEQKNYEAAIESFRQELSKNPTNWHARQQLGLAYLKTGQNDNAIAELQYVLGQEPADITALSYAPQDVERGLGQNPDAPYANFYLGLAYLHNGQRGEAVETWRSYKNPWGPMLEAEIKKQLTIVEISNSIHLARQALEEEKKLETLPPQPGTIAVFYFKDLSPDNRFRYLQKAMAEMIITDLTKVKSLTVLERMRIQFLLSEMQMGQTGIVEEKTAPRAGRLLGAENLIVGSLEPGSLAAKASVASTTTKDVVGAFSVTAEQEEFFVLEKEIVYNILKILPVTFTPEEEAQFKEYHTKSLQAVLYFGEGLDALDAGQWKDARIFFKKATEEDPDFKLAKYYLERCPAATVASLTTLGGMTVGQLADNVEASVDEATADQEGIIAGQGLGPTESGAVSSPSLAPGPSTGSVSLSW
jgi:tetratricopeptide (TPR) repeat protein